MEDGTGTEAESGDKTKQKIPTSQSLDATVGAMNEAGKSMYARVVNLASTRRLLRVLKASVIFGCETREPCLFFLEVRWPHRTS